MTQMTTLSGASADPMVFGAMQFGGHADDAASRAMYDICRGAGLAHFDTAHVYTEGRSETLLGQFAADERDDLIIATKVGYTGGAGASNIRAQFDISRQRLALDCVDLLYLHRFDPETDLRETMACFTKLKADGQIRYVGLSNFAAWQVVKAQWVAAEFELTIDVLQPMYNLVKRQAEVEILPMCMDQSIGIAPYSPLGGGLLTGKYSAGGSGRLIEDERYAARYGLDWMHETARDLSALADQMNTDAATLAVAWVMAHESHPMPIISGRSAKQLAPSLAALEYDMSAELYARLSALSPTPPPATDRIEEQA